VCARIPRGVGAEMSQLEREDVAVAVAVAE
jgi:hypothetical protein